MNQHEVFSNNLKVQTPCERFKPEYMNKLRILRGTNHVEQGKKVTHTLNNTNQKRKKQGIEVKYLPI